MIIASWVLSDFKFLDVGLIAAQKKLSILLIALRQALDNWVYGRRR